MNHIAIQTEAAIAAAEKRATEYATKYARDVLHLAENSNHQIARVLREQREAEQRSATETTAVTGRLDRLAGEVATLKQENIDLRTELAVCKMELARATGALEKEIARERSLRRLLDAQRGRPHVQKVASELARRHAQKTLEAKSKTEAVASEEAA